MIWELEKIREGFETNSSSSHSLVVTINNENENKIEEEIKRLKKDFQKHNVKNFKNLIEFCIDNGKIEFGWGEEIINSFCSKFNYLLRTILKDNLDNLFRCNKTFIELIQDFFYNVFSIEKINLDNETILLIEDKIYIDHNTDIDFDILKEMDINTFLKNYFLSDNSFIILQNDNSSPLELPEKYKKITNHNLIGFDKLEIINKEKNYIQTFFEEKKLNFIYDTIEIKTILISNKKFNEFIKNIKKDNIKKIQKRYDNYYYFIDNNLKKEQIISELIDISSKYNFPFFIELNNNIFLIIFKEHLIFISSEEFKILYYINSKEEIIYDNIESMKRYEILELLKLILNEENIRKIIIKILFFKHFFFYKKNFSLSYSFNSEKINKLKKFKNKFVGKSKIKEFYYEYINQIFVDLNISYYSFYNDENIIFFKKEEINKSIKELFEI